MQRNIVYIIVLMVIMIAWCIENPTLPTPATKQKTGTTSQIVSNPSLIGFSPETGISGGDCNIEFINGVLMGADVHIIPRNSSMKLTGWAMDLDNARLPESVIACFTGSDKRKFFALSNWIRAQ